MSYTAIMFARRSNGYQSYLVCLAAAASISSAACIGTKIKVAEPAQKKSIEGTIAPDFAAVDHRGETVVLSEVARKNSIAILVFYRGSW